MKTIILLLNLYLVSASPYDIRQFFTEPKDHSLKIINGHEAIPHSHPSQVGIFVTSSFKQTFCGGSLISKDYVLTAAHCADGAVEMEVILGAHKINEDEPTQIRLKSTEFIVHEEWDDVALVNDIALVKLPNSVSETDYIKFVELNEQDQSFAGEVGLVAGWGLTKNSGTDVAPVLMEIKSTVMTNTDCKAVDPFDTIIQDVHMCLSGDGNIGTCLGDSGGPLMLGKTQIGLVSFGYKDCEIGKPSVFTRLGKYINWIKENTQ